MPLIQIRYKDRHFTHGSVGTIGTICQELQDPAAKLLSCEEGGALKPEDIMFEVTPAQHWDRNIKDFNMRVIAHDFPSRRARIDDIRKGFEDHIKIYFMGNVTWYVWVLLSHSSYGSNTVQ